MSQNQSTLFDKHCTVNPPVRPPAQRVRTSIEAANRIAPHAGNMRERVYEFLREAGSRGATRAELAASLGMRLQTVCGRCSELLGHGGLPVRVYQTSEAREGGKVLRVCHTRRA